MRASSKLIGLSGVVLAVALGAALLVLHHQRGRSTEAISPTSDESRSAEGASTEPQASTPADANVRQGENSSVPPITSETYDDFPEAYTDREVRRAAQIAAKTRVRAIQDKAMAQWPAYSEVREELAKELAGEIDLEKASAETLAEAASRFRERFWQSGGNSSRNSYRHVYKARLLLELAHDRRPEDLFISDELVQTLQAAQPLELFEDDVGKDNLNDQYSKMLLELRSGQFELLNGRIAQDEPPTLEDFVRAFDLAVLQSRYDPDAARLTLDWMEREAPRGQWTGYDTVFEHFREALDKGERFWWNIYIAQDADFPHDFRYQRRLPSFWWPGRQETDYVLWGRDDDKLGLPANVSLYHKPVNRYQEKK